MIDDELFSLLRYGCRTARCAVITLTDVAGLRACCVWRLRQLEFGVTCIDDVTRLLYCSMCGGRVMTSSTPRCRGHCSNVVRACLAVHAINVAWNEYLCQSISPSSCLCLPVSVSRSVSTHLAVVVSKITRYS